MPRLSSLATAMALAVLAGCQSPAGQDEGPRFLGEQWTDDAFVVPSWRVGDYWAYASEDGSRTERHTVVALDEMKGIPTYQVKIDGGPEAVTMWLAREDLARVYMKQGNNRVDFDCGSLFPFENRTVSCFARINGGDDPGRVANLVVGMAQWLDVPAGRFWVRDMAWWIESQDLPEWRDWYGPDAGYSVQGDAAGFPRMVLTEWGHGQS